MGSSRAFRPSRREFLAEACGIAAIAATPLLARASSGGSTQEHSDADMSAFAPTTGNASLTWAVFQTPNLPTISTDLAPDEKQRSWPPISSTLICGERDAVLVDAPFTVNQARALTYWVAASGKNLTTIYSTHGHGDHFFGVGTVLERFPNARFVARPEVIQVMRKQASQEHLTKFWNPRVPGQIPDHIAIAEELTGDVIHLEGHELISVPLGSTDTADTTCLHVPSIGLIVAGDAAYNGIHLHLNESGELAKRQEWLAALDKIESLKPRAVIAGHKAAGKDDSPRILGETRGYIQDFDRLAAHATTAQELYGQMIKRYPDWANHGALWSSVHAVKA
jgi:glyoxylase-like metal-dependent hydrolase (beta-lactamase superfamily II)